MGILIFTGLFVCEEELRGEREFGLLASYEDPKEEDWKKERERVSFVFG